ncbi:mitochondrial preribosomal assembly factor rimM [Babesia ovis]|uniref:Mitochondrial preribosomal assembly factor rimM n=1 Tax=Babesia ovis TaxID=5869 RepID=A0A9W5TD13_BABOV|nr:mitochondrial preribosomal assembly factor rimM [Babesia ovis]
MVILDTISVPEMKRSRFPSLFSKVDNNKPGDHMGDNINHDVGNAIPVDNDVADVNGSGQPNGFCSSEKNVIEDLVLPNKYYKRSKYSKVGFKEGLKKKIETHEERMARTFNIFAPMPKEEMIDPNRKDAPDLDLLANIGKYVQQKARQEMKEERKAAEERQKLKQQAAQSTKRPIVPPKPQPVVRSPNAILIDKSMIFSTTLDEYIVIGKVLSPHGLRGHVKVRSLSSNPEVRLCEPGYRFLKFPYRDEKVMPIKIEYGRLFDGHKIYRLKLEGVDTREQAMRLNGAYLSVSIRDVPPLEEDCYYSRDLLNMDVYLFNDSTKTCLGKVVDFWHREDLVSNPKYASIAEDLIEIELDMRLSLRTLLSLTKKSKDLAEQGTTSEDTGKRKGVSIVTDRDLDNADEIIDAEEELVNSSMMGVQYVKFYTCSHCKKEFTNYTDALEHDRAHEANAIPSVTEDKEHDEPQNVDGFDKICTLDESYQKRLTKPVRRFYIPLIKEETVKFVDVPNKSIYVEAYSIFIGEDGNPNTAKLKRPK